MRKDATDKTLKQFFISCVETMEQGETDTLAINLTINGHELTFELTLLSFDGESTVEKS